MRVVLDTNVLVSGLLSPFGPPGRIRDALLAGTIAALYDERMMDEYREVLARPVFEFERSDIEALLDYIESTGHPTVAPPLSVELPDPDDLPFLEVAVAEHADALVTGNVRHFKPLRGNHQMTINTPAEFLTRLKASLS